MRWLKMNVCAAAFLTVATGCASLENVVPVAALCTVPPAPPAWAMQDPSNSLKLLDELFLISDPASSAIKER